MKVLSQFKDIHSHIIDYSDDTVVSLDYTNDIPSKGYYSIGIHPWQTYKLPSNIESILEELYNKSLSENVVAIGECGIDKLKGASLEKQIEIFKAHVDISEKTGKPLIIHAVKSFNEIIALKKELKPTQTWIIHGFRGKPQIAQQLINNDICLSIGLKFNQQTVDIIPPNMLYHESDRQY